MKVAFVIQRYGIEVNGGSELHCRWVAEHLSDALEIEILTTCSKDYISWKNEYAEGTTKLNGILVRRFPVEKKRNIKKFNRFSEKIFNKNNPTKEEELRWVDKQGPQSHKLIEYIKNHEKDYDYFIFFTYLYFPTVIGLPLVAHKALLVPTAHDEPPIKMSIYKKLFTDSQALIYNTKEEKDFVNKLFDNKDVKSEIIGTGINLPNSKINADQFKNKNNLDKYVLYVGRIEEGKGVGSLIDNFLNYVESADNSDIKLVLIGKKIVNIVKHPSIIHLGFVSEEDKFNAIAGAEVVIVPSQFESLSMITLESWLLGKPVLVNGRSPVLVGNCKRSNGGLYYNSSEEFRACLDLLLNDDGLRNQLGKNGQVYFKENYDWPIIKNKYLHLLLSNRE